MSSGVCPIAWGLMPRCECEWAHPGPDLCVDPVLSTGPRPTGGSCRGNSGSASCHVAGEKQPPIRARQKRSPRGAVAQPVAMTLLGPREICPGIHVLAVKCPQALKLTVFCASQTSSCRGREEAKERPRPWYSESPGSLPVSLRRPGAHRRV